jgi:hypothetical protein
MDRMNEQARSSWRQRSSIGRFCRWLVGSGARVAAFAVAVPVALIVFFYVEEDLRGWSAWRDYRRLIESRGEQTELAAFIPKPVSDEQNFAATPFVQSWFPRGGNWDDDYSQAATAFSHASDAVGGSRRMTDLVGWAQAFNPPAETESSKKKKKKKAEPVMLDVESRAKASSTVLAGMKSSEADLTELAEASRRPYSRYPVVYDMENPWGILLPHLAKVKAVCQRLQLRASAELASGQSDKAMDDVKLSFYMIDSVKNEPFLISYLVRIACLHIGIQPVWEGLAEHRWTDAQLQELQAHFGQFDLIKDLKTELDSERAAGILTTDLIKRKGIAFLISMTEGDLGSPGKEFANAAGRLIPSGWYNFEKVNYCRIYDAGVNGGYDPNHRRVFPRKTDAGGREIERGLGSPGPLGRILSHRLTASKLLPAIQKTAMKAAAGQVAADEAEAACAIERFRLANGRVPESLAELSPKYITVMPKDVITGEAYKYRRADAGFVLYSVGWDGKDEDGEPGSTLFDDKQGDWVWQNP